MSRPFRVLYREFLFRMVDLEILSLKADITQLLGQIAALLIFVSFWLAVPALAVGGKSGLSPEANQVLTFSSENFLIATTLLVVGLFAVLSWDSTFLNRRDVCVLTPLPLRGRTLFLAKIAAAGTALALTIACLHGFTGIFWPLALHSHAVARPSPVLTYAAALPPVDADGLKAVLDRDLAQSFLPGSGQLAPETGAGVVAGVLHHGTRRIYAYGTAKPDSIFEIGNISKTFTALLLARMAVEEKVKLNEPVRELLAAGTVAKPPGVEIDLLDLATHRSGLPKMARIARRADRTDPEADYSAADLFAFMSTQGVAEKGRRQFQFSNLGYSLLAEALAQRAGKTYPELLESEITGPFGLHDTVVGLSAEQPARFIQGHNWENRTVNGWQMDGQAGAGGIRSTASDMLTYLDAQLHPASFATDATLARAIEQTHQLHGDVERGLEIGLAWFYDDNEKIFWSGGETEGYSAYAFFDPKGDYAAIVLLNRTMSLSWFIKLLGDHIRERLAGEPAISLDNVVVPASSAFFGQLRFFGAYWLTMIAAGAFSFCLVLGIQGIAAQLLPRQLFLRVSSHLQLAAFCLIVCGYMFQPIPVTPKALVEAQSHGLLYWSPSYWFLGLFQQLIGSPALSPLARRAWLGLAICGAVTAVAYMLSYLRTLRKIVEEPDIVSGSRGWNWLPRFRNPLAAAVTHFSIRTLLRSRQHRMILAFYWGIAFAVTIFITKSPEMRELLNEGDDPWFAPNVPVIIASVLVFFAGIIGMRVVMSIPLELRANWIFQITPVRGGPATLLANRQALYLLGLVPVWTAAAILFFSLWTWRYAAGHLLVLALIGITLTEVCLSGFYKIPFTCSYLPGKSKAHMAFQAFIWLIFVLVWVAPIERRALDDPTQMVKLVLVLSSLAGSAIWRTSASARSDEATRLQFEEAPTPAIFALDLHRDGTPPA